MPQYVPIQDAAYLVALLVSMMVAITFHEAAHGFTADFLGDPTPRGMGRLSLNPLRHVDVLGTLLIPLLMRLFEAPFPVGWAKPILIDPGKFRHVRRDSILVAAAGPLMNLALALLCAVLLALHGAAGPDRPADLIHKCLSACIELNLVMFLFNLLPLPPLDGSKLLLQVLPWPLAVRWQRLERHGMLAVLVLMACSYALGRFVDPGYDFVSRLFDPLLEGSVGMVADATGAKVLPLWRR